VFNHMSHTRKLIGGLVAVGIVVLGVAVMAATGANAVVMGIAVGFGLAILLGMVMSATSPRPLNATFAGLTSPSAPELPETAGTSKNTAGRIAVDVDQASAARKSQTRNVKKLTSSQVETCASPAWRRHPLRRNRKH